MKGALALLCALAAGCGSPAGGAQVVPRAELPARERALLEAWERDGAAWELERSRVLEDPALTRFLIDNLVREMVRTFDRSRIARPGEREGPFERSRAELLALPRQSAPVLAELLAVRDGVVAFLAADLLAQIGASALPLVQAKLGAEDEEVRRRAAELLGRLPQAGAGEPEVEERLGACVLGDAAWIVRAEAARALGARAAHHTHKGYAAGVLARALADADDTVVESAAQAFLALAEPRAIPFLIQSLEGCTRGGKVRGVAACQRTLRALSGVRADLDALQWWEWWVRHGPQPRPGDR